MEQILLLLFWQMTNCIKLHSSEAECRRIKWTWVQIIYCITVYYFIPFCAILPYITIHCIHSSFVHLSESATARRSHLCVSIILLSSSTSSIVLFRGPPLNNVKSNLSLGVRLNRFERIVIHLSYSDYLCK
jgi:hypothetical protein